MSHANYTAPTPKCPNCGENLLVKDFITDSLADCHSCARVVTVVQLAPVRDISHSPVPQRKAGNF